MTDFTLADVAYGAAVCSLLDAVLMEVVDDVDSLLLDATLVNDIGSIEACSLLDAVLVVKNVAITPLLVTPPLVVIDCVEIIVLFDSIVVTVVAEDCSLLEKWWIEVSVDVVATSLLLEGTPADVADNEDIGLLADTVLTDITDV